MDYKLEYERWCKFAYEDEIIRELETYSDAEIEDAFYRNLTFGTGGVRGIIGAGINRINVYTVSKVSQGLSNYLKKKYGENLSVVIGYDSRKKSDLFAKTSASVFAANGIIVNLWPYLTPVPTVAFAVRHLHNSAGIMITASHNPSKYNGYKVYGSDGCQITTEDSEKIFLEIDKLNIFSDIKKMDFDEAIGKGIVNFIDESVLDAYINAVKEQSVLFGDKVDLNVSIVYSPLNGTGYLPVTRVLSEAGYKNIILVEEQRLPDENFSTCPYPNPEIREALSLGLDYCKRYQADLLIVTDPDCDRVGIAVRHLGEYLLLSGNEVGLLLLDYICSQRSKHGKMPTLPIIVKTIVTTDLGKRIAEDYGVKTIDVLTGFKFIGEQIGLLDIEGKVNSFIFGFEESYGYLSGTYVRDKDAVNGSYLICEMFAYYKARGIELVDKLNELFKTYGYCLNTLHSFSFEGVIGMKKMLKIMSEFRSTFREKSQMSDKNIIKVLDYNNGIGGLPKSDVLKYQLEGGCSVVIRPSGTEPKLKVYLSIIAGDKGEANMIENKIIEGIREFISGI